MKQLQSIAQHSILLRGLEKLSNFFGAQWKKSAIIHTFLSPSGMDAHISEHSMFHFLWKKILSFFRFLYQKLHLNRIFQGSITLNSFFFCMLPAVLAPLLPTMPVLALCIIGVLSLSLRFLHYPEKTLAFSPINRYLILYLFIYLAGTLFSVTRQGSLKSGLLYIAFFAFCIVLQNAIETKNELSFILCLIVVCATVVSFYGICQYLFGWGYQSAAWVDSDMFSSISFRVPSTLQNPNMLGQYLILTICLGGAMLLQAKSWGGRIFYTACCGIMCLCMILTFSRGAWLGLLCGGFVFLLMLNPRFIFLAPFAAGILFLLLPDTVISRFASIGNLGDASTSYRVYIWYGAIAMLKDYWLCGIGPGDAAFNLVYPAYSYAGIVAPHAHNLFLQIVCDAGILALIVFLLILFHYFRTLCAAISREKDWSMRMIQIGLLSGVAGFLVQAMTDYSFYNYRVLLSFAVFLALGMVSARANLLYKQRGQSI